MAEYRLGIAGEIPLWPALKAYNGLTRLRFDVIQLQLRCAIYAAMEGQALLDRPIAHELMQWAGALPRLAIGETEINCDTNFTFCVTRIA